MTVLVKICRNSMVLRRLRLCRTIVNAETQSLLPLACEELYPYFSQPSLASCRRDCSLGLSKLGFGCLW